MKGIIENITSAAGRAGTRVAFKLKKASPELLIVGGVGCIIAGTVMACKATKKANDILDHGKLRIDAAQNTVNGMLESGEIEIEDVEENGKLFDKEIKRELVKIKLDTFSKVVAAYAPAVAIGTAGIAMIFTSHGIMRKRNGVLLASYNALDAAFKQYRSRVLAEEDGFDRDRKYLMGPEPENQWEMVPDGDAEFANDVNKRAMVMAHQNPYGLYTFEFSKYTSNHWSPHADSNLLVIRSAEDWATRQLTLKGHLFLNDVLDYLDMEPVPWGQLCGWIRGSEDGDSYVEMLATIDQQRLEMDTDGWKKPIFLTFNCEGLIWDKI